MPERLPPGRYTLYYTTPIRARDHDTTTLRISGPAGLSWDVTAIARPGLLDLLDEHHGEPEVNARLMAVLVEAAIPIVREMIQNEKLPSTTRLEIEFDDTHLGLAHAVNSNRPLTPPSDGDILLTVERKPQPAAGPPPARGQRRRRGRTRRTR